MKVALDGTPLTLSTGGLARYTAELSRALAAEFPADEFLLLSDQPFPGGAGPPRGWRRRWWTVGLSRELARRRVDVFHGTNFEVPYLPLFPSVLTLHDLSPWREDAWRAPSTRVRRRTPFLLGLGIAGMVITVSEAVRREAIEWFRLPPARVVAIPLAAAPNLRPVEAPAPAAPYFLYVGAIEPRKNLPFLVEAWRQVRRDYPVDLVLAGRPGTGAPQFDHQPGLTLLGEVPEPDLAALYSGALAFVYPSLYEGFGLPVLEAMRCGAPVIASRIPAISEVAGGAAIELDPSDGYAWAEALRFAAAAPAHLEPLRDKGLARAAEFTWARTAHQTRDVYEEAARRFSHG